MTLLSYYEGQVADLLHDPNNNKWTIPQLDSYINQARRQLCFDSGCLRQLQSSYITQGEEVYTFGQVTGASIVSGGSGYTSPSVTFSGGGGSGVAATLSQSGGAVNTLTFTNQGSGYTSAPNAVVSDGGPGVGASIVTGVINSYTYDVLDVHVYWGTERYSLLWCPFRQFSARYRPYSPSAYQRQPVAWAVYGENQIYIGPTPDQTYQVEFDTVVLPVALTDYVTADTIPLLRVDCVQYYAAYMAKQNAQSFGEAESFKQQYENKLRETGGAYVGRIPDPYEAGAR